MDMLITNKTNTAFAKLPGFNTNLLIGETNSGNSEISIQITEVEVGGRQFVHSHEQPQCYYICKGNGLMMVGEETENVKEGDSIFVPGNESHGIENTGPDVLIYLSANRSFGKKVENELWPSQPDL